MSEPSHIRVRGARVHNLRGVDVDVPRNALVVFTGVSGSGKSSLAFDTLYQEGQRRFVESLSSYARQFLGQMERPAVDAVEGISPTLSIDQKTVNRNPRSTVGTVTEILDHLRLLFARLGTPHCPVCHTEISQLTIDHIIDAVLAHGADRRVQILGPIVQDRKGEYRKELEELRRDGWLRVRVDGGLRTLDEDIELARYEKHTIEVVVDRLKPSVADRPRLAEAIESALALSGGAVSVLIDDEVRTYATQRACPNHPEVSLPEVEPRLFSFNAPQGACPTCNGLGALEDFELDLLVDLDRALPDAFRAFNDAGKLPFSHLDVDVLKKVVKKLGGSWRRKLAGWDEPTLDALLWGASGVVYKTRVERPGGRIDERERVWAGLIPLVQLVWKYTHHKGLEPFRARHRCHDCDGARLNAVARGVTFRGRNLPELVAMDIGRAHAFFDDLVLVGQDELEIGGVLVREIQDRLAFLDDVGLGYLSLSRSSATLSGGEAQRIRLAAQVGSALQGVTYVLDEPSIGLHPRDNARLLQTLFRLRDRGNSVLVVEHDEETIRAADHVVDVGPGAGREGGLVVASTTPAAFVRDAGGRTAPYLRGDEVIAVPESRRSGSGRRLVIRGAEKHNLQHVDLDVPLGTLTVVTGVSGSGKSTLVFDVLRRSVQAGLAGEERVAVGCRAVEGLAHIDKLVRISQQPIGRTPRSNPATYTGAFDVIRDLFARTPEARARGYKKGRFSFNVKGGRCEACEGAGVKTVEMQFLPNVSVPCEVCDGRRFNDETLEITYKSRNIHDVLDMSVAEAAEVFANVPRLARILNTMVEVGLGYVPVGQPSTTLSGGEAQRVKLATELHRPSTGQTLYLLDEPTTGLHFHDVAALLRSLQRLVDQGNTVVVVEHHTDVIKCADHLIDLGPEGGNGGGRIVGEGSPEALAGLDTPTGQALAALPELGRRTLAAEPHPGYVSGTAATPDHLVIRGARMHNLQGVDVSIPHNQLTVITGVSGSGKTSLAFDTIFAEGQRRYVESLSTYARRFLGRVERAPLESIEGLKPAIAIDQKSASHNPRSTVATVTEIHDVLRLLYARVGIQHCPVCNLEIKGASPSEAAGRLGAGASGAGWLVTQLRPVELADERRKSLVGDGWVRLLDRDGSPVEIDLADDVVHARAAIEGGAWLVLDRLNPSTTPRTRLSEAIRMAYALGAGVAAFVPRDGSEPEVLTELATCPDHGVALGEAPIPRHFSFNSRLGACPTCDGLGKVRQVMRSKLFPAPKQPFWKALDGRVAGLMKRSARTRTLTEAALHAVELTPKQSPSTWTEAQWTGILEGIDGELDLSWSRTWSGATQRVQETRPWEGLRAILRGWNTSLDWLVDEDECPDCRGARLKAAVRATTIGGLGIHGFTALSVDDATAAVEGWPLAGERAQIAARARLELSRRLSFLSDVGLGYLSLDRAARTLSGGESQRIRLASQLGSQLTGVLYVLDEPTVGLHPRDTDRLMRTLEGLRDLGNTVVVVEHDPDTIRRADHVLDMGPGAGRHGGYLLAAGTPGEIAAHPDSVTGRWLSGESSVAPRKKARKARSKIRIRRAVGHNLDRVTVDIPTGVWTGITGVSGSGKSSLIMDTLAPALRVHLGQDGRPLDHGGLTVGERIDRVVVVDQQPIGRSPRSTPATYTKLLDGLRKLFSETAGARERGWKPGRFSFNAKGGRCAQCEGRGAILIEMHFLPDVWVTCPTCKGRRYNRETLAVRWRGHSIADVLAMRADEALEVFAHHRRIAPRLQALVDVGLGYLTLGQPGTTLSGGEAQRVKLASELTSRRGHAVYILDEPTTGLHLADVAQLVSVLHALVDQGHTVITIEHHLDLLAQADHIIDLGPDGGAAGGQVVGKGRPGKVAKLDTPTGRALADYYG